MLCNVNPIIHHVFFGTVNFRKLGIKLSCKREEKLKLHVFIRFTILVNVKFAKKVNLQKLEVLLSCKFRVNLKLQVV